MLKAINLDKIKSLKAKVVGFIKGILGTLQLLVAKIKGIQEIVEKPAAKTEKVPEVSSPAAVESPAAVSSPAAVESPAAESPAAESPAAESPAAESPAAEEPVKEKKAKKPAAKAKKPAAKPVRATKSKK